MKSKKLYRSRRTRVILSWDCSVEQTRAKTRSEESEYRESTWTRPSRYYFSTRLFSIYDDEKKEKEKKKEKKEKRKKKKNIFMWISRKWKSSRRDRSRVGIAAESSNRKKFNFRDKKNSLFLVQLDRSSVHVTLTISFFYFFLSFILIDRRLTNWQLINLKGNRSRPRIWFWKPRRDDMAPPAPFFYSPISTCLIVNKLM